MARPTWKGSLSFGLVTIGVELYTMEQSDRLELDMLDKRDNARIGYQKINKSTGEVVPQKEIVKGYPVAKNKYVILNDADFKAANPKATRMIDVIGFVDSDEIGRIYFDPGLEGGEAPDRHLSRLTRPRRVVVEADDVHEGQERVIAAVVAGWFVLRVRLES